MPDRKENDEYLKTDGNSAPPAMQLEPETILNQRYVIVLRLHQGKLGPVYLAKDRLLGDALAVKELAVDPAQRENTIKRFQRYAKLLMMLHHPSIPAVYDAFYAEQFGRFYVVMEYVVGSDLVTLMLNAPKGRLDEKKVTQFAVKIADALEYLHNGPSQIIYRNLKPARIVVTENEDRVMLMHWFGLWANEEKAGITRVGTMGYAPPELFDGRVEPRFDVYSLGATMFQLLTGVDPQDDPVVIFDFARNPQPRQLEPSISTQMEQILMRAVDHRPEARFSAAELRDRLTHHLNDLNRVSPATEFAEREPDAEEVEGLTYCRYCGRRIHVTQTCFCGVLLPIGIEPATVEEPAAEPKESPTYLDENVQFTIYRPNKIKPLKWYPLLAYAHLTEPRDDEDDADPIARVEDEAKRIMRDRNVASYRQTTEDSRVAVPRRGEISFVPFIPGIDFNPSRGSFFWEESVHRQDFRMRASATLEGKTARGKMSVFLGTILLAEINLSIQVTINADAVRTQREKPVRPYRRIFPSYSHKDREIVAQIEHYAQITGDKYMRDVFELRSGENWKKWMGETIGEADIFQLFWSTNSMRSENVRLEWEHALQLKREHFIRPTYWETPLPASPSENLPPPELRDLHFQHVRPPAYVEITQENYVEPEVPSRLDPEEEARNRETELSAPLEQKRRQEEALRLGELRARVRDEEEARRRAEEEARRFAEEEARIWAEVEARRRAEEEAPTRAMKRETDAARISKEVSDGREVTVQHTTQSRPVPPHAAKPLLWVVTIVLVLGLLLLLLVGFLIWRN